MALTTLREDLTNEFREEMDMLEEQIEVLSPLGTSLRQPAAQRILSSTSLIIVEYLFYLFFAGGIVFLFKVADVYPFSVLNTVYHSTVLPDKIVSRNVNDLVLAGYGVLVVAILLFLVIGRMANAIRMKNAILHQAGKDIKIVLGQQLERKAAVDTIQQRHQVFVPGATFVVKKKVNVHEVKNPGYDEPEEDDELTTEDEVE